MRRLLFVIPACLFTLNALSQQWKTFTDSAGNFTASYPSNWVNKIKAGNRVFFTSPSDGKDDTFYENINIAVSYNKSFGKDARIRDLFPTVTQQMANAFSDFKEESLRYFKWNNYEAAELVYSGYSKSDESIRVRCTQWFCFYKSKLYLATFVSDAEKHTHDKTAKKIMSGIVFK